MLSMPSRDKAVPFTVSVVKHFNLIINLICKTLPSAELLLIEEQNKTMVFFNTTLLCLENKSNTNHHNISLVFVLLLLRLSLFT